MTILSFDLQLRPWHSSLKVPEEMFQMELLPVLLKENNCAKLFWNPIINVKVMAQTSSIYAYIHFMIWPSRLTLTFNIPEHMFQMALLLVKENNSYCAKLFRNPSRHVHVLAWTDLAQFYNHFIAFDIQVWPWPSTSLNNVSNSTTTSQGEQLWQIIFKSMHESTKLWPWQSQFMTINFHNLNF